MSWDASPTSLKVMLKGDSKPHYFESMACLFQSTDRVKLEKVRVTSYTISGSGVDGVPGELIDAFKAHYLYDTKRIPHSMPPFIAAFKSKDAALKAQKELGGDYATFDRVWSKLGAHFKKKGGH
jgi:nitrous oxide reductase accessory protein NosL